MKEVSFEVVSPNYLTRCVFYFVSKAFTGKGKKQIRLSFVVSFNALAVGIALTCLDSGMEFCCDRSSRGSTKRKDDMG